MYILLYVSSFLSTYGIISNSLYISFGFVSVRVFVELYHNASTHGIFTINISFRRQMKRFRCLIRTNRRGFSNVPLNKLFDDNIRTYYVRCRGFYETESIMTLTWKRCRQNVTIVWQGEGQKRVRSPCERYSASTFTLASRPLADKVRLNKVLL